MRGTVVGRRRAQPNPAARARFFFLPRMFRDRWVVRRLRRAWPRQLLPELECPLRRRE